MKRRSVIWLCVAFLGLFSPAGMAADAPDPVAEGISFCDCLGALGVDPPPLVEAPAIYLVEAETGDVLYAKGEDLALPMASTTKIMTVLLACESRRLEETAIASGLAAHVDGSRIYLREGEPQTLLDLAYAAMLESANDACIVIAEHLGGSIEGFAEIMNERAAQMGLEHTWFVNPHGLPDEGHRTSARDLAILSRHAMRNQLFRTITATKNRDMPLVTSPEEASAASDEESVRHLWNHNRLLFRGTAYTGIKPGYTSEAGYCLAASARRDDTELIAVILGARTAAHWDQVDRLLDWGFESFEKRILARRGQVFAPLTGTGRKADAVSSARLVRMVPAAGSGRVESEVEISEDGPGVFRGQAVGTVRFLLQTDTGSLSLGSAGLTAEGDLPLQSRGTRGTRAAIAEAGPVVRKALWTVLGLALATAGYRAVKFERSRIERRRARKKRLRRVSY